MNCRTAGLKSGDGHVPGRQTSGIDNPRHVSSVTRLIPRFCILERIRERSGGNNQMSQLYWIPTWIGVFIFLYLVLGSFFTVRTAEVAVITRFGKFLRVAEPGLNW